MGPWGRLRTTMGDHYRRTIMGDHYRRVPARSWGVRATTIRWVLVPRMVNGILTPTELVRSMIAIFTTTPRTAISTAATCGCTSLMWRALTTVPTHRPMGQNLMLIKFRPFMATLGKITALPTRCQKVMTKLAPVTSRGSTQGRTTMLMFM